jgi:hypothetical protein
VSCISRNTATKRGHCEIRKEHFLIILYVRKKCQNDQKFNGGVVLGPHNDGMLRHRTLYAGAFAQ